MPEPGWRGGFSLRTASQSRPWPSNVNLWVLDIADEEAYGVPEILTLDLAIA